MGVYKFDIREGVALWRGSGKTMHQMQNSKEK